MNGFGVLRHPLVILAAALAVLPFAMQAIGLTTLIATEIVLFALIGLGFNLLLGYTGLLSFGHAAYLGAAAYATGYADQPHLNREFRALAGATPVTFVQDRPAAPA